MNCPRIALAGFAATLAYFALGFILLALLPLADEVRQFASVYRPEESMMRVAPIGMAAMLLSLLALTTLFASAFRERASVVAARAASVAGLLPSTFRRGRGNRSHLPAHAPYLIAAA